ncbi:hypothetical protein AVEN_59770-1 [Araneus ventricosus]|uniref:Uncharacterized protein n=1 Tax=Araneus ventricosus TaxID=182803 RepID=A0A4Y2PB21_ARAVE|nr:hypothetical protein AVEN_59770-1 [Araneus ventricosus]
MADIYFFGCSLPVRSYSVSHDVTKKICERMLSEREILQMLHNLSETNSGSDVKSDSSQDAHIPGNESEPTSSDRCFTEIAQSIVSSEFRIEQN